jgi:uncharacterized membrane protein
MLKLVPDKKKALSIADKMFSKLEKYDDKEITSKDVVMMGLIILIYTVRPFALITCFLAAFFAWSVYKNGIDVISIFIGLMLTYWMFSFVKISLTTLNSVLKEQPNDKNKSHGN